MPVVKLLRKKGKMEKIELTEHMVIWLKSNKDKMSLQKQNFSTLGAACTGGQDRIAGSIRSAQETTCPGVKNGKSTNLWLRLLRANT